MKASIILDCKVNTLLPQCLLEALWELTMTAEHHRKHWQTKRGCTGDTTTSWVTSKETLHPSIMLNWVAQWRLGRAHMRKQEKVVPCSKSSCYFLTSLERLIFVWRFCNLIFSWFWLLRSVSLPVWQFTQWIKNIPLLHCHFCIFHPFSPARAAVIKRGAKINDSTMFSPETSFHFNFSFTRNICSKSAQKDVCWVCVFISTREEHKTELSGFS